MTDEKHQMVTQIEEVESKTSQAGKKYLDIETTDGDTFLVFDNKYMEMSQDQIHALILENKGKHFRIDYSFGEKRGEGEPPMFLNGIRVVDPNGEEFEEAPKKPVVAKKEPFKPFKEPVIKEVKDEDKDWDEIKAREFRSYAATAIARLMSAEIEAKQRERYDLNALKIQADEIVKYVLTGE